MSGDPGGSPAIGDGGQPGHLRGHGAGDGTAPPGAGAGGRAAALRRCRGSSGRWPRPGTSARSACAPGTPGESGPRTVVHNSAGVRGLGRGSAPKLGCCLGSRSPSPGGAARAGATCVLNPEHHEAAAAPLTNGETSGGLAVNVARCDWSGVFGLHRHTSSGWDGPDAWRRAATAPHGPELVGGT
jgi:hypothetical protein